MSTRARPAATRPAAAPQPAAAYHLPGDRQSTAQARNALRQDLQIWGVEGELADSAELLLSELVTNAVQAQASAGPEVGVGFAWADGRLRLEVRDASDGLPVMNDAKEDEECGRGLVLVDVLASGWGVGRDGTGKTVWAELAVCDASAPRPAPAPLSA
ncbi:ATP-binding protein [Streptomyces libani]|uniref:ATP-binding protein n=1 Tax=Streptomyces nigrescens TaxID=1920 RepID=UPI003806E6C1